MLPPSSGLKCVGSYRRAVRSVVIHTHGKGWRSEVRSGLVGTVGKMTRTGLYFSSRFPGSERPHFLQSLYNQSIPHPTHFSPEGRGSMFLRNVGIYLQDHTMSPTRTLRSEKRNSVNRCVVNQYMGYCVDNTRFLWLKVKIVESGWYAIFILIGRCLLLACL
jgi:hypothetical protein